jgi:3-phosphoshikimate 1-carboxyvinyltransferase
MAFLVLGLTAKQPVRIDDAAPIATSFPGFIAMMIGLGAAIDPLPFPPPPVAPVGEG